MLVEIFSDVVCPWCAVGKRRFEAALRRFDHGDQVDVIWRAYELDPTAPARRDGSNAERLAAKYGMTSAQAVAAQDQITATAAAEGLDFHLDGARSGNTFDAHRLLHYALEQGRQNELQERLFVAYFTEGVAIGERENLARLAAEVGLDPRESAEVLAGDRYADEVRADERDAHELGVSGVPFFVIDRTWGISGAQDPDTILGALQQAWKKSHPLEMVTVPDGRTRDGGDSCEGDNCAV
jgi:predicted DsbA family dithiol-disulfide isomerase